MMSILNLISDLHSLSSAEKARNSAWFFKTGKGEYGYGDKFMGCTVPEMRKVAKKYVSTSFVDLEKLLNNKIHEYRFTALEILVMKYEKADVREKKKIVSFYLKNKKFINNWDLVDTSVPYILGDWLLNNDRSLLYKLAKSKLLWERRMSIVSTYAFIRVGQFTDTLKLASILMNDEQDLIHKAVGWMLRELGKKSEQTLIDFLDENWQKMPRTMLRYAVERLGTKRNKYFPKKKNKV
jgi:3-methyladenine DNA glycosylase AlkD